MRTTVTLDEDVTQQLRQRMRERGTGFKETINELLRRGLHTDAPTNEPFVTRTFDAQIRPGIDLDKALALAAAMEDDEIVRKLTTGK